MIHNQNEKDPDAIAEEILEVVHVPVTKNSWLNPSDGIGKLETGFVLDSITYGYKFKPNSKELQEFNINKNSL
jgi:hypothetical protein